MELEIKQKMLEAREDAKHITEEAEAKAEEIYNTLKAELKEKEAQSKKTDDRLVKKEELLDKRRIDIDTDVENIKKKIEEIHVFKERAEALITEQIGRAHV